MKLSLAKKLALHHMGRNGLEEWSFHFSATPKRFGLCDYVNKSISLSRYLVWNNELERVERVILHEIAHALTPRAGHGPVWQEQCAELGIPGETQFWYEKDTVVVPPKFLGTCPSCNKQLTLNRVPRNIKGRVLVHKVCQTTVQFYPNPAWVLMSALTVSNARKK